MKITGSLIAFCLLCLPLAQAQAGGPAEARGSTREPSSSEAVERASVHFQRGVELFREEAFRASLAEFQRAYDLAPDYRLLYNLAQTKLEVHDYLGAAESYERYLATGSRDISAARRAEVEEALVALRERVATVEILVNREGADVFIDDVKVGRSPIAAPLRINLGDHRVKARTTDGSSDSEVIDVAGGDAVKVTLELAVPAAPVVAQAREQAWTPAEKAAVATWSMAGALAVGALTTGILAQRGQNDYDKLLKTPDITRSEILDQRHKTQRLAITTDILAATAVVAAVAGTISWVLGHDAEKQDRTEAKGAPVKLRAEVGLGSFFVHGQF